MVQDTFTINKNYADRILIEIPNHDEITQDYNFISFHFKRTFTDKENNLIVLTIEYKYNEDDTLNEITYDIISNTYTIYKKPCELFKYLKNINDEYTFIYDKNNNEIDPIIKDIHQTGNFLLNLFQKVYESIYPYIENNQKIIDWINNPLLKKNQKSQQKKSLWSSLKDYFIRKDINKNEKNTSKKSWFLKNPLTHNLNRMEKVNNNIKDIINNNSINIYYEYIFENKENNKNKENKLLKEYFQEIMKMLIKKNPNIKFIEKNKSKQIKEQNPKIIYVSKCSENFMGNDKNNINVQLLSDLNPCQPLNTTIKNNDNNIIRFTNLRNNLMSNTMGKYNDKIDKLLGLLVNK